MMFVESLAALKCCVQECLDCIECNAPIYCYNSANITCSPAIMLLPEQVSSIVSKNCSDVVCHDFSFKLIYHLEDKTDDYIRDDYHILYDVADKITKCLHTKSMCGKFRACGAGERLVQEGGSFRTVNTTRGEAAIFEMTLRICAECERGDTCTK